MTRFSTPFHFIRVEVFGVESQDEFARLLNYSQAQVSRFETGERKMSTECQERIIALAGKQKRPFDANWFFAVPDWARRESEPEPLPGGHVPVSA